MTETIEDKPVVHLIGHDGNSFAILAACQRAARKAHWTPERIAAVLAEMKAGDRDHLLQTALAHFDVR